MYIKPPKIERIKKVVSLFDVHIPNNIPFGGIFKFLEDENPDELIIGGDFMDVGSLSHWNENKRLTMEGKRYLQECKAGNDMLDRLRKAVGDDCKIIYLFGNHELWVDQYIELYPELQGIIDIPVMLRLKERNIKWIPYDVPENYYKVGKLYYTHGEYTCTNHAKKMLEAWKCNIRYGHLHTHSMWSTPSKRGIGDFHKAISIPCLCKDGDYLAGKSNNWSHGFHIAYIKPNGNFWEYVIPIINGEFYFNNKKYASNINRTNNK